MKIYLVGGAVRDQLLGLPVLERDYVVVGARPEELLEQGFKQVGKDFPVFLHPETHEEYALARTERKTGKGYTGFAFFASPEVTLEEDLLRRDLTINAMAQDEGGHIIDPYHGQEDLKNHYLRHVSLAFVEDPVRILRAARFAARFVGFNVHPETLQLMKTMVTNGEVDALVPERVWQEFSRALSEQSPQQFLHVLQACGALTKLFPEISDHEQTMKLIEQAAVNYDDPLLRFASLWLKSSPESVMQFCLRNRVPTEYKELAMLVAKYYRDFLLSESANAETLLNLLEKLDAFRRTERFNQFLQICHLFASENNKVISLLKNAYKIAADVAIEPLLAQGLKGSQIADALHLVRSEKIAQLLNAQH